jgi:tape measure domain-containing protein
MAAPQLRLEVSLNLLGFRNEIRKLTNIAQSEFVPKINVKFNRQTLDAELNNLQRAIKRRVYRVEIGGNIDALPSKIKNLKEQLASIESLKIDLGIGAVKSLSKRDASKIKSDLRAEILGEQKKIYVPVSIKPSIVKKDVLDFKNAVQSKLSGITVKVKADLEAASISGGAKSRADINADVRRKLQEISEIGAQRMAGGGGGVTEAARRAQLKRSLETGGFDIGGLKDIGKQLGVAGVGRFKNVNNLIEKIVTESSIEMVKKYLDPQAVMRNPDRSGLGKVLDTFARGIFNMLGMDPASIRAQQQSSKPKPFTPAGLLPAAYRGIGPSAEPAGLLPPAYRGIGPSRNAGALPGTAFGGQKYLPTALGEELKEVLRGAANAFLDSIRQNIRTVAITDMGAPPSRQGLLKGGSVAGFLPGRASAASVLELNNILAGAIREYFKAVARDVAEAGRAPISTTPLLSSASPRNQLMLPPAGGTTANLNRPRTTTGSFTGRGYEPPGGFASNGMLGGRQGPATFIGAGSQMEKFKTVLDVATASTQNFRASQIPLIGGIKSLAGEFGEATKQVLLYGTAYKGLAFLISLPGQVLNAAKSQQQFNNGLKVATQETGTFAKELLYVDNVQRAFGLNLETTRTGFTRLYASMSPTGFDSGSIEKLFTGISAATASLQLTPDKAERVIYAFGQMASKGQIMSEELKGQLGDVLPGALAIFSKAAGMSVKEFSKAMEDGEFVGTRFREVFAKVSDELMNRFGTGAQVAGRSLQGLINTVGGDFQRTLESFAPLANAAAQATLGPLTGMLREVSMAAQIAMGEQDRVRKQLEAAQTDVSTLKAGGADAKEIKAAEQNVAALAAKYEVLNEAARDPAIAQQVKNIEAFVAEVQKAATFTMNFAGVIGSVLSPLFAILGGNLTSVIGNLAALALGFNAAKLAALLFMGVMNAMRAIEGISRSGAVSVTLLTAAYRALGVQITAAQVATLGATGATTGFSLAIKGLLISTGIGAVIVLLGSLAAAFLSVGNSAKAAADKAKRSIDSMADAARTGNVAMIEMELAINKADRQDLEGLIKNVEELKGTKGARGVELVTLTPEMKREAKRLGIEVAGEVSRGSVLGSLKALRAPLAKVVNEGSKDLEDARKRAESLGMNKPDPGVLPPESPGDHWQTAQRAKPRKLLQSARSTGEKLYARPTGSNGAGISSKS